MLLLVSLAGAAAFALLALTALVLFRSDRRTVSGLRSIKQQNSPEMAFRSVINARSEFTKAVQDYEQALVQRSQLATTSLATPTDPASTDPNDEITTLEQRKERRRSRLLDAQRLWEAVRPAGAPDRELDLWVGNGVFRQWQIGPIGREMVIVRFDHATDDNCWVVWSARRYRVGVGVGAESRKMSLVATGCTIDQLENLTAMALAGGDIALRPGFSPMRVLRRLTESKPLRRANSVILRESRKPRTLARGPSEEARDLLVAEVAADLGYDMESGSRLPVSGAKLKVTSRGPSLLLGAWVGRRPAMRVLTRSNHSAWRVRSVPRR